MFFFFFFHALFIAAATRDAGDDIDADGRG